MAAEEVRRGLAREHPEQQQRVDRQHRPWRRATGAEAAALVAALAHHADEHEHEEGERRRGDEPSDLRNEDHEKDEQQLGSDQESKRVIEERAE
ncbi:MAG: hypothetical protein U0575_15560 [Phycisphaerales bacterium]